MAAPAGAHLLIAEDDPAIRKLYQDLFAEQGYQVSLLDGLPQVAEVQRLTPDLLILDFFDSGASALELIRAVRSTTVTADLPVVVCSASLPQVREIESELAMAGMPLTEPTHFRVRFRHRRAEAGLTQGAYRPRWSEPPWHQRPGTRPALAAPNDVPATRCGHSPQASPRVCCPYNVSE